MDRNFPGIVIAGTSSGVGKTTIATGLMGACRRRGLVVQPFKVGPDFIDPSYHSRICDRSSRNLDSWMLTHRALREIYARAIQGADLAIVEGVMGLFDGRSGESEAGSSAEVAKLLGLPVVLVIDAANMARSAAAVAYGYSRFDPDVNVVAVIANNVASETHLQMVKSAIEGDAGLPVIGHLFRNADLRLRERHLGLIPTVEERFGEGFFDRLPAEIEKSVDLQALMSLASEAAPLGDAEGGVYPAVPAQPRTIIAIARDEAFNFYYQDNLDLLTANGASLTVFSPLHDQRLPDGTQGLYLGGGFPELYAAALSQNEAMREAIRQAHVADLPIYAECGGLMYLCQSITDLEERTFPMVGIVPGQAHMQRRRLSLGYTTVQANRSSPVLRLHQVARGHEFHWSSVEPPLGRDDSPYRILENDGPEGYQNGHLLASYVHLHFASQPAIAANFVQTCQIWRAGR